VFCCVIVLPLQFGLDVSADAIFAIQCFSFILITAFTASVLILPKVKRVQSMVFDPSTGKYVISGGGTMFATIAKGEKNAAKVTVQARSRQFGTNVVAPASPPMSPVSNNSSVVKESTEPSRPTDADAPQPSATGKLFAPLQIENGTPSPARSSSASP